MLRVLVIALVALVGAMMLFRGNGPMSPESIARMGAANNTEHSATVLDTPRPLPAVELVDQHGTPFSITDLAGTPVLVFFGFTNCPDICPTTLDVLARAVQTLAESDASAVPEVLFVSVDPTRDTPARIGTYIAAFDDRFHGATAAEAELQPLLSALSVSVHKEVHEGEAYNVVHNGTVYVLNRAGEWAAIFGGSSHDANRIADSMRSLQAQL